MGNDAVGSPRSIRGDHGGKENPKKSQASLVSAIFG
jgi:hypothetical protein